MAPFLFATFPEFGEKFEKPETAFFNFLTHLEFSYLLLQICKTLCKSLEEICNIAKLNKKN